MPQLRVHTKNILDEIAPDTKYGIYLVHSQRKPTYFRLGVSGVGSASGPNSRLLKRLRKHNEEKPARAKISRTEGLQRWEPLWAGELLDDPSRELALFAEGALFYHFGRAGFVFSQQTGEKSMFVTTDNPAKVLACANTFNFERLLSAFIAADTSAEEA